MNHTKKRALVLVSDAYGGRGGIALYNRNLLKALSEYPDMERVVVLPRNVTYKLEEVPANVVFRVDAVGSKLKYLSACLRTALAGTRFDLIVCGHLNLLPCAWLLQQYTRCPMLPVVYGIDAWNPTSSPTVNYLCSKLDGFISIRHLTAKRLIEWSGMKNEKYFYLPNCINGAEYGIKPKRNDLIERYGLYGKIVIATAGRLDSHPNERNKGFDEILETLPELKKEIPNLVYLIIGDGDDAGRLVQKAKSLAVGESVIFTGYVPDREKADHYRLADVFAMPGSNSSFDRYPYRFVFLESLACGVPVVGCKLDDPVEMNDPDSKLIIQVDPNNKTEIIEGIHKALASRATVVKPEIQKFFYHTFRDRFHEIIRQNLHEQDQPQRTSLSQTLS